MKLTDGNLYFRNITKNNDKYSYLNENINCDVLIVGAGISGAISAYYMAEEGYDVIVLDKNIVGFGSTSSSVGIIDTEFGMECSKLVKFIGEKNTKKCANLMMDSLKEIKEIAHKLDNKDSINFKLTDYIYFTNKYMNKNAIVKEYNTKINMKVDSKFVTDSSILDLKYGIQVNDASATINVREFTKGIINYISKKENVRVFVIF